MLRLMRVPTFAAATRTSRAATRLALGPPKQLSLFSSKVASLAEQREDAEQPAAPRLVITDRCVQARPAERPPCARATPTGRCRTCHPPPFVCREFSS